VKRLSAQIDDLLESYDYDSDPILKEHFHSISDALWNRMEKYDANGDNYGKVLCAHLKRTSEYAKAFFVQCLGFSEKAANNFYQANLFQDLGKTHHDYDVSIWNLPHRPTKEDRVEKRQHVVRGHELMDIALTKSPQQLLNHPHIEVIRAVQLFHHECVDGSGMHGKDAASMSSAIKAICIIDAFDGDQIYRPHQDHQRTPMETLERMQNGKKYKGAFDAEILTQFIDFIEKQQ